MDNQESPWELIKNVARVSYRVKQNGPLLKFQFTLIGICKTKREYQILSSNER